MLKLQQVSKQYREHTVFRNVSLDFSKPGVYILQGTNGSGKSTLLKILAGIIYKSGGAIDKDVSISYLPDKWTMPKLMRVKSYCYHIFEGNKKEEYYHWSSLFQVPNRRIGDLSKGNQQKLGLIQVFSLPADVYILDEPMDGLDEASKKIVKDIIKDYIAKEKVILLSLHNKTFFNELKPTILEVKEGEIHERKKKAKDMEDD